MKYLALVMLVSTLFAGSASAHAIYGGWCTPYVCQNGIMMDKDKAQNMMHYYPMHQPMHYHMMYTR